MNNRRALWIRAGLFAVATLAIATLGAWLLFGRGGLPIQTDLLAMLPNTERNPLAEVAAQQLAHANGDRMVLLVENTDDDRAKAAARALGAALSKDHVFESVLAELPPFDLHQFVAPYLAHRFVLLSDADREALSRADYDPAQALARHLNEPFLTSVGVPLQDDPFGWLQHWQDQQPWTRSPLLPEDNLLTAHRDDRSYVMVTATLRGSSYDDTVQRQALAALGRAEQAVERDYPGTHLLRTGAVFYAAAARAGAEHDVHMVGWISSLGIALLLLGVFRSPGPLLLAFLSTAVGVVAATTVTLLVFGQIYLLTLVFGAALLGEAVDYSIQYLSARANAGERWQAANGLRQVRPALLLALGTSLLGYALLGLVPFPALRQMAVFAMSGMLAACLSVFWLLPALLQRPAKPLSAQPVRYALALQNSVRHYGSGMRGALALALLVLIAIPGWWRLSHDDDIHLLIAPPTALAAQDAQIREITGLGNNSQFYLVQGDSIEQTLQREEALEQRLQSMVDHNQLQSWLGLAGMVPSLQRQHESQALLAPLMTHPERMQKLLVDAGFKAPAMATYLAAWPGTSIDLQAWLASPAATPFRYLWLQHSAQGYASLVLPQGQDDAALLARAAAGLPGVQMVDKAASVSALFGTYRRYASVWLLAALLLIVPVFGWRYGWGRAPRVLLPPLCGIGLTLAALGYLAHPLTLFHWMALMLVLGVGANYALFLHEGEPHVAHRPGAVYTSVLLSAITALLSFGLLALSSMPALREFGLTLLLGIGFTALLVPASMPAREHDT
ncbi:MMPL family transporter [Rhodanobacter sp. MP7CTX1]|uniref:MMPL family transporter n=1 Tax=Rhodanobacter sp. MP7CTX1 TaxID=2723084 RepID=UPI00160FCA38|nr:MMPL family transporter [Rhodanobacter sp. MP7CTX1]MBB6187027.1 putative exporter [Rhodanobacter sp. MP7CTX1]